MITEKLSFFLSINLLTRLYSLLRFYEAVFRIVPIFHPEDLLAMYEKFFGKKDEKALKARKLFIFLLLSKLRVKPR